MPKENQNLVAAPSKPKVFIGSSLEGLPIVEKLAKRLARFADCRKWTKGVFGVGKGTLEALVNATREHDFAILVLTPDDQENRRGAATSVPRDNVIFELGLFMGALGKNRTFIVKSKDQTIALPTDLSGITRAEFSGEDIDGTVKELQVAMRGAPTRVLELTGDWYSSYQRHDPPVGVWVDDKTRIELKPPAKLSFRNYSDQVGSEYEAIGELRGDGEIVGIWWERIKGAHASGSFQLYIDPYGKKLYGVCTGPNYRNENIYSGWALVRQAETLNDARNELRMAMLVDRRRKVS